MTEKLDESKILNIRYVGVLSNSLEAQSYLGIELADTEQPVLEIVCDILGSLVSYYGKSLLDLFISRDYQADTGYGPEDAYIVFREKEIEFSRDNFNNTEDVYKIDFDRGMALILEAFLNYYWFLKSVEEKYRPEWYEQLAEELKKHYPKEFEEYDSKPLVELATA